MKTILPVSAVLLVSCASAPVQQQAGPVTIRVTADRSFARSDVDALVALTAQYVNESVRDGRPLSLAIRLGVAAEIKPESSGYLSKNRAYGSSNTFPTSLEDAPTQSVGYYTITNDSGTVVDSNALRPGTMAEIARIVADRVAGLAGRS